MSDLKSIEDKITAAKVKKLTLQNNLHLNAQLHKEVSNVQQNLTNAEESAKIIRDKELDVRHISQATDSGYRQTVALTDMLTRSVSSIETRLNQLSLSKDRSVQIIRQKAHEKLSAFPKGPHVQRQHELLADFLALVANISNQDTVICCNIEEEIKMLQGVINEKTSNCIKLNQKTSAIKDEITSTAIEIENSAKLEAQFEESVASSSATLEELQSHLMEIVESIPSEEDINTSKNELQTQEINIGDTEREIATLNTDFIQITAELDKFKRDSAADFAVIQQTAEKEEVNLDGEIIDLEDEISQTEVMIKGAIQRRDIVTQKMLRSHPGKTLAQLEEELNTAENAEIREFERLKLELDAQNNRKSEQENETRVMLEELTVRLQSQKELLTASENDLKSKEEAISKKYYEMDITLKNKKEALEKINMEIDELEQKKTAALNSRAVINTPEIVRFVASQETQVIAIKTEPSIEEIPQRKVPIIEGIESFSPETKRKRDERKKTKSRVVEHSLEYTDLSMDSEGRASIKSPGKKEREKRPSAELKRLRMAIAKRKESGLKLLKQAAIQAKEKPAIIQPKAVQPATGRAKAVQPVGIQPKVVQPAPRMPSSICSVNSFDDDMDDDDGMNGVVKPPPGFLDDSLYEGETDFGNVSMDSLFTDSPTKNARCIPENVFLDQSGYSSLTNFKTPPANVSDHNVLDDSLDDDGSLDQTVWD